VTNEYERRGLYDPAAPNAADRLALLEWLAGQGITVEQMVASNATNGLTALAGDLAVRPEGGLTVAELAARAGIEVRLVERVLRAAGFPAFPPDERFLSPRDVGTFELFTASVDLFGEPAILRFIRVAGTSMAQIAETAIWSFLTDVEGPMMEESRGELALAQANLTATRSLELLPQVMETLFRGHVEAAIRRSRVSRPSGVYDAAQLAVGFVDLVGFTSLSEQLPSSELARLVDEFEERAFDIVAQHDGRVVKLIGDEVMFVTLDPVAACAVALELVESFGGESNVTPRGGLAVGELLTRAGDYFGPVVNTASRIADLAVPSEILVTTELAEAAAGSAGLAFGPAGRRMLKGLVEPVELFAVTRLR
jgi:adenylate cyclase